MEEKEWEQIQFDRTFDEVYANLKEHRQVATDYSINDLRNFLESLYVGDGNNWDGRGSVTAVANSATIAACETFLLEWKEEIEKKVGDK